MPAENEWSGERVISNRKYNYDEMLRYLSPEMLMMLHLQWHGSIVKKPDYWCKLHHAKWADIATSNMGQSKFLQKDGNQRWRRFNTFYRKTRTKQGKKKSSSHHHKPMTHHRKLPLRRVCLSRKNQLSICSNTNLFATRLFVDGALFIKPEHTARRRHHLFLDDQKDFPKELRDDLALGHFLFIAEQNLLRAPLSRWDCHDLTKNKKEKNTTHFHSSLSCIRPQQE